MAKMQSERFLTANRLCWEEVGPGVRRRIMGYDPGIMMVVVEFQTGAVGAAHSHPHSQVTYVECGRFEVTIGDRTEVLGAGEGFHAPPGETHGVVCLEAGSLIDVFSPCREDFL